MKTKSTSSPAFLSAHGFTLVEVLVALLVLSIGLLGIAKLSFSSVQSNSSAYMRGQASALAQQILDDMHANRDQAVTQAYDVPFGTIPVAGLDCSLAACTAGQTTTYDQAQWKSFIAAALPEGDGKVVTVPTVVANGTQEVTATISVQWNDLVAGQLLVVTVETVL